MWREGKGALDGWMLNSPARHETLSEVECAFKVSLPSDYKEFLLKHDGGEGPLGRKDYLILYESTNLIQTNNRYNMKVRAPGLFLFGSDGSGEAICFDTHENPMPIVSVTFTGMALDEIFRVAPTFTDMMAGRAKWVSDLANDVTSTARQDNDRKP